MSLTLRPYQIEAADAFESSTERRVVLVAPTGSGKTAIAMEVARRAHDRHQTTMFMAPRRELIKQVCQKLDTWAPFGYGLLISGDKGRNIFSKIQVASVDTLVSRVVKRERFQMPDVDLVILDEAHLYQTELRAKLLELLPQKARILGLTATPARHDGKALAITFDKMIETPGVRALTEQGFLVPANYYAPSAPDLTRVRVLAGEYNQKDVQARMEPLLGDITQHWMKYAADRRTVLFAASVGHSVFMAEKLRAEGVTAEHCDANTPTQERDAIFERFSNGETQMLCNVDLATYGFDLPELDCVVLARPTKSIVRYLQALGRGLRRSPSKKDCLVLDHSGAVHEHGKADDERYWTLDGLRDLYKERIARIPGKKKPPRSLTCPQCHNIFSGSLTCPFCDYYFEPMAKEFHVVDGELVPFQDEDRADNEIERMRFYCELKHYGAQRGYKPGWAAFTYKERHKDWPPREWAGYHPIEPSDSTRRYIRHLFIRRAKGRAKARRDVAA